MARSAVRTSLNWKTEGKFRRRDSPLAPVGHVPSTVAILLGHRLPTRRHPISAMSFAITAPRCGIVRASRATKTRATKRVAHVIDPARVTKSSHVVSRSWSSHRSTVRCSASNDDDIPETDDGMSSSFAEELKRRRERKEDEEVGGGGEKSSGGDRWASSESSDAPRFAEDDGARGVETEQLKKSRALQNEGLEGFPTRAGELLKLGFSSFISFGPLIAVFSVLFVGTYLLMGSDFIHGGDTYENGGGVPAYVPPEVLLAEPTVDRMVPMYDPVPLGQ